LKFSLYFELTVWVAALVCLSFAQLNEPHFKLCPVAALGFTWCPGCGLGRSIAAILHGSFSLSFHYHWFGFPALLILIHRIFVLGKKVSYLSWNTKQLP